MTDVGSAAAIWFVAVLLLVGAFVLVKALRRSASGGSSKHAPDDEIQMSPHRLDRIRGIKRDDPSDRQAD